MNSLLYWKSNPKRSSPPIFHIMNFTHDIVPLGIQYYFYMYYVPFWKFSHIFSLFTHMWHTKNKILFFFKFSKIESGTRGWMCLMCANTQNMGVIAEKYFCKPNSTDFTIYRSYGLSNILILNFNILAKKIFFAKIFGGNPNMRVYKRILIFLEKKVFFIFTLSIWVWYFIKLFFTFFWIYFSIFCIVEHQAQNNSCA